MSKSTWTGAVSSDWDDSDNWSPAGVPDASSDVTIAAGEAIASASIGTINSITDSSDFRLRSAGTNTVATFVDNSGHLWIDHSAGGGGTILNIGGSLTNSDHLHIGNATLSAPDEVSAAALNNTGEIRLLGSSADQALLDVTAGSAGFGAAGVLSGSVRLAGDSAIEFASGEIASLADNAQLRLNGNDAFIEDSATPGSNSALTGLDSIGAGAIFGLHNGTGASTSGPLDNAGQIRLDGRGDGGSSLTVAGTLTNSGGLDIGNGQLSASVKMTVTSLDNTGAIGLTGSDANQALLNVTGTAGFGTAEVLSGQVELLADSAIEFASGEITSLAPFAQLDLGGRHAFIEDSTALGSNSALAGLASIGAGAFFYLRDEAAVSTTGSLVNDGTIDLVAGSLTVAGTLTNTSSVDMGGGDPSVSGSITTESLVNTGMVSLSGDGTNPAALNVSGTTTNNGSISIVYDTEELAGAVGGAGSFTLSSANLQFDSSVSAGQTVYDDNDIGRDALTLEQAQSFAATISGFNIGDTI